MLVITAGSMRARAMTHACRQVVIGGEVNAGQEWNFAMGEGWVFRILPIVAGQSSYSGWDLVVDRVEPAGFPDALLLATLPYNSINEREVGTTFGLRAQDAIGWNPRSFRFLSTPIAFSEGRQLYFALVRNGMIHTQADSPPGAAAEDSQAMRRLLELESQASAGQFRILDARLAPGIADAASYAESWALAASRKPHQIVPSAPGKATPHGALLWLRFSISLWLPHGWNVPAGLHSTPATCPQ
jgi:hypothetical protein